VFNGNRLSVIARVGVRNCYVRDLRTRVRNGTKQEREIERERERGGRMQGRRRCKRACTAQMRARKKFGGGEGRVGVRSVPRGETLEEVAAILAPMVYPRRGYVLSSVVLRDGVMIRQRLFRTCQKD